MRQHKGFGYSLSLFIASFCYLGFTPCMPGTLASGVALLIMYFCYDPSAYVIWLISLLILIIVGSFTAEKLEKQDRLKDPSWIVIDEVVAMMLLLLFVPFSWQWYLAAFVLFRFFDITKCAGIWYIDQFSGGIPLMCDDIAAAAWSLVIIRLACFVL
jgi:phosphatidylglycerophosphatase A